MTRKTRLFLCLVFCLGLRLSAAEDWKAELRESLAGPRPDYGLAMSRLEAAAAGLEGDELQAAAALLPYLASRLGLAGKEQDAIIEYFERYRDNQPDLSFLDDRTFRDFLAFWAGWRNKYPLVSELVFLYRGQASFSALPATVEVGLQTSTGAYYRISLNGVIIEGGLWPSGWHVLTIPVAQLFSSPGSYEFMLDLKSDDLVIRKPIRLDVDVTETAMGAAPPAAAPASPLMPRVSGTGLGRPAPPPQPSSLQGTISLYIDDKLIMSSRKSAPKAPPIEIPIPGPSMPGQKPYMPPPKSDPMANGVSILDALALAYRAVKDLLSRKPPPPPAPTYQKVTSLSYSFVRTGENGTVSRVRAVLSVGPGKAFLLKE